MEEALRALLTGHAPLTALLGTHSGGPCIFWADIPQGAAGDVVVMHKLSGVPSYTMGGPVPLRSSRVQINTRADKVTDAWAISRTIEALLSGYRGTVAGIVFGGIFLEDDAELPTDDPAGPGLYRGTRSDYIVWSAPAP